MSVGLIYICLLGLGVVYALMTGVFGWLSDMIGGGGGHVDIGGHDVPGHLDSVDASHSHPISGTTAATFVTGFGGGGIVAHYLLGYSVVPGLLVASGSGFSLAFAAYLALDWLFKQTQGGSEYNVAEATGREAEVISAIPAEGMGEIAYLVRGRRENSPARAVDGAAIAKGRLVVIEKTLGNTFYVRPLS